MVIEKKISEYSNRQRINLNKSDGLESGQNVIILTRMEYMKLKDELLSVKLKLATYEKTYAFLEPVIEKTIKTVMENLK